jgi:hypothetical protein
LIDHFEEEILAMDSCSSFDVGSRKVRREPYPVKYQFLVKNPVDGVTLPRAKRSNRNKPNITFEEFDAMIDLSEVPLHNEGCHIAQAKHSECRSKIVSDDPRITAPRALCHQRQHHRNVRVIHVCCEVGCRTDAFESLIERTQKLGSDRKIAVAQV